MRTAAPAYTHFCAPVYGHVHAHISAHAYTHVCTHAYTHAPSACPCLGLHTRLCTRLCGSSAHMRMCQSRHEPMQRHTRPFARSDTAMGGPVTPFFFRGTAMPPPPPPPPAPLADVSEHADGERRGFWNATARGCHRRGLTSAFLSFFSLRRRRAPEMPEKKKVVPSNGLNSFVAPVGELPPVAPREVNTYFVNISAHADGERRGPVSI